MQIANARNFTMAVTSKVIAKIDGTLDKVLNKNTINPNLVRAEYAVRGELAIRAEELKEVVNNIPSNMLLEFLGIEIESGISSL